MVLSPKVYLIYSNELSVLFAKICSHSLSVSLSFFSFSYLSLGCLLACVCVIVCLFPCAHEFVYVFVYICVHMFASVFTDVVIVDFNFACILHHANSFLLTGYPLYSNYKPFS